MTNHSELNSINAWLDHEEQEVYSKGIEALTNVFQNCQQNSNHFAEDVSLYFKKIKLSTDKDIMNLRELVIRVVGPQVFFYSSLFARLALILLVGSREQVQKRWHFLSHAKSIAMKNNVATENIDLLMFLRQTYNNSLLWHHLTEIPGISTFDRALLTITVYEWTQIAWNVDIETIMKHMTTTLQNWTRGYNPKLQNKQIFLTMTISENYFYF